MNTGLIILLIVVGILILSVILYPKYLRFVLRFNKRMKPNFKFEPNPNKPITETIGKLTRKRIDKNPTMNLVRMQRYGRSNEMLKSQDYYWRYYLTFETFKGYKSFTVEKDTYRKYAVNKYGIIKHQKSKFISFEYRSRDSLNLDERIKHN